MATDVTTNNLKINILPKDEYDDLSSKKTDELYVIKEDAEDTDNAISSRTYADVGREAVVTSATVPTSEYTQIWIDTEQQVVYNTPANNNMDNITDEGQVRIQQCVMPKFTAGVSISNAINTTYTLVANGWLYGYIGESSNLSITKDTSTGIRLMTLIGSTSSQMTDKVLLEKGTTIYIKERSGTTELVFYPCKGIVVE